MINCAHSSQFTSVIEEMHDDVKRIWGFLAKASKKSHDELDESEELDIGDIAELRDCCTNLMGTLDLCIVADAVGWT